MEDAHTYIYNFGDESDAGYFGIFDGHAGREAADWCSKKLHTYVESWIFKDKKNKNDDGGPNKSTGISGSRIPYALSSAFLEADSQIVKLGLQNSGCTVAVAVLKWEPDGNSRKRMLYTANVGDARIVLSRGGKAYRLTYDHKGSDPNEARRVQNLGGIMMNNRVNGVLAVTRSLGDSYMKDFVSGAPFTTETKLSEKDEFLIVACDGLWDVCQDSAAVDIVRDIQDPTEASKALVSYALANLSSDNLTCMVIRLDQSVLGQSGSDKVSPPTEDSEAS